MTCMFYYICVRSSLHSSDSTVFGLTDEEVTALLKKYGGSHGNFINGVLIKATPIQLLNSLSEIGYKITCCSGESELTWTMMSRCKHDSQNQTACQTLDELDFERGIWFAAQQNDTVKVKKWIDKKDVNETDKYGYTALHYASRNGHLEICKLLISHGANVNALTGSGKATPLHRCVSMGHHKVFDLLVDSGASIEMKDGDGKTILHRAVEAGYFDLAEKIINLHPALARETDNRGCKPKEYSNVSEALINLLKKYDLDD